MLNSLQRDMGNGQRPEEDLLAQKIQGIARVVATEKKIKDKRQKQEIGRSQDMLNSLLQYSIMMNGGGFGMYK